MIRINLLPVRAAAKKETLKAQLALAVVMLVLVGGVVGYLDFSIRGDIEDKLAEIKRAEDELKKLKDVAAQVEKFKKDSAILEKKLDVIKQLNLGRTAAVYLLDELSNVMPEKLWLLTVRESKGVVQLNGIAVDHDTIADFMSRMERSALFSQIKLSGTQQEKSKSGIILHKFNVEVQFLPPKPKEEK